MKFTLKYYIIAFVIIILCIKLQENFASTSPGTLMQLVATGAQDIYLTGSNGLPPQPVLTNQNNIR